uniref:hypothetical protein n=1 Tax=Acinetobacter baumannii TaxID=470 RepID=UPI001C070E62
MKIEGNEKKVNEWFNGPNFLWQHPLQFDESESFSVSDIDPELVVDTKSVMVTKSDYIDIVFHLESRISSFLKMKKVVSF